ncbi:MAG: hypothetical protein WDA07_13420 [Leucobacter sp.]
MRDQYERRERLNRGLAIAGAAVLVIGILWIDISTGIWQDLVIAAGLAAGLVTFLLSALVLNRIIARQAEKRWAPVNRLAVTEFLHAIADDEKSEVAHGVIVARSLPDIAGVEDRDAFSASLHALREAVARERSELSGALSRWAEFLTTSGDNELTLRHVADIALQLDQVRDTALEIEQQPSVPGRKRLLAEIAECNTHFASLIGELQRRLAADTKLAAG